ncbi:MAG: hypothetical protein WD598_06555 [Acidimicrobiia bacterium]
MSVVVFAAEVLHKTIWYPTILGILVVLFAVALFCGSLYVLLATNLGARLGFLIAFTGLTGFMVVLTLLWLTTASPLNTLKGRIPEWNVEEVVANPAKAKTAEIRDVEENGRVVGVAKAADVKAAVDEALVTDEEIPAEGPLPANANKFAKFVETTEYKVEKTYEIGGSEPNPLDFEITHKPLFAVAEFCELAPLDPVRFPFGVAPPKNPPCDEESENNGFIVLSRDLGSVRVPPMVAFGGSSLLFLLGLLSLHWRERDEQEAEKRAASTDLVPAPAPANA